MTLRNRVFEFVASAGREVSVAEIAEAVGARASNVSAALGVMLKDERKAGVVYPGLRKVRKGVFVVGGRARRVKPVRTVVGDVRPVEVVSEVVQNFTVEDALVLRHASGRRYVAVPINA